MAHIGQSVCAGPRFSAMLRLVAQFVVPAQAFGEATGGPVSMRVPEGLLHAR